MILLTFDTDYMRPEWMDAFVKRYVQLPKSTFFAHPDSDDWSSDFHEVNEHPVIKNLDDYAFAPNRDVSASRGIRSHSCVSSHLVSLKWANSGLLYQSQETRWNQKFEHPERTAWGIYELPISYMDNQDIWMEQNWPGSHAKFSSDIFRKAIDDNGTYLFDFHPLHIALNTSSVQDYAEKKSRILLESANPWELATTQYGTRDFFEDLLRRIDANKTTTSTCIDFIVANSN
jgi:hypothetical protein